MPITETPNSYTGHQFFTRKVLASLLDFFSKKIYVERYDEEGNIFKYIQPPIHFSNRSRFISLVTGSNVGDNFNTDENVIDFNYILPRMSLSIAGMSYLSEKKLSKYQKLRGTYDETAGSMNRVMSPVPYQLSLELSVLTNSIDDTFQILEQVLPYFAPSLSFDINTIDGYDPESVSFSLTSITPDNNEEFGILDDRIFLSTMSFDTVVNYYFIKRDATVIKDIIAQFYVGQDDDYKKIKQYELNASNLSPVTTIAERVDEPVDVTITTYDE